MLIFEIDDYRRVTCIAAALRPRSRRAKGRLRFGKDMESILDIARKSAIMGMESKLSTERRAAVKNRLEEIRKQHGIKQEELAAALEVSRQTIGSLENGRYNPSILLAFKIARYFGMQIEDIFIYEEGD